MDELIGQQVNTEGVPEATQPPETPQDAPKEIVLRYESPTPREVVERFVAPAPEAPPAAEAARPVPELKPGLGAPGRRGMRGLWVLVASLCILLVAVVVLGVLYWQSSRAPAEPSRGYPDTHNYSTMREVDLDAQTNLARYPNGDGTRLRLSETHGSVLSIQDVYARVNPCTVTVATALPSGGAIIGTGVIFTSDGYILTNAHVISGGQQCFVVLDNGTSFTDVKLVGFDSENDLAVIKVDAYMLPTAEFGDSDALAVGDTVYAIGNPLGVELRGTLTDGIVSAINRDVNVDGVSMTLIQTNAALNNGNSGGPLINIYGQVVGINTMKMGSTSTVSVEGLGFAIPVSSAAWMVDDLIEFGEIRGEPVLGISVLAAPVTLSGGETALQIVEIVPGGPGEAAGLRLGDSIVRADGEPLSAVRDLLRARRRFRAGETLRLEIERGGERLTADVILDRAE